MSGLCKHNSNWKTIVFAIVKARIGSHKTVHIIKLGLGKRLINILLLIHKFCQ